MTKSNVFLAALVSSDARQLIADKIDACEAKRSPLIKLHWTHEYDLHATLGFIPDVEANDIRKIALALLSVSETAPFMAHYGTIKLYGSALVLCLEPYPPFIGLHKKMNQKLIDATNAQYQFDMAKRYNPHITLARVRNVGALNPEHKLQLQSLVEAHFKNTSFLIQQAALMRHQPEPTVPAYETLQLYPFSG